MLPPLPGWIVSAAADTLEAAAFRSGAALAHLALVADDPGLPQALSIPRLRAVRHARNIRGPLARMVRKRP